MVLQIRDIIHDYQAIDSFDFQGYLGAGGTISFTRVSPEFLKINLSGEDLVNVFGGRRALNAAEDQLAIDFSRG